MLSSNDIRRLFLDYFTQQGHTEVASSSLVPGTDPTLLFTNAGMVQFKHVFLGQDKRHYSRATTSQRCVRAGGKHNDLDNVGYTARHHTFFEMLGNFSFGDYFKKEAIQFSWDFLTNVVKLPPEKLWVTVFEDDQDAATIWLDDIGIDPKRFAYIGEKDNFWSMGDTGPCGPCTEIFYDHGADIAGGPPGSADEDGDRFIEIWNLVFMEYNRDSKGKLNPLPKPSVDTGMGLERLTAILQGVHDNYHIDIFQHLIKTMARIAHCDDLNAKALRVIADHIRSACFLMVDGVVPANEGRGYVLRRIIRRAVRHGHQLGVNERFFYKLVQPLIDMMGDAYPELAAEQTNIETMLKAEETQFAKTLNQGLAILDAAIQQLEDDTIPGELVFKLYDTYGFPMDLTADIAKEHHLNIDIQGFEAHMDAQRARARQAGKFKHDYTQHQHITHDTEFLGYQQLHVESPVQALIYNGEDVTTLTKGQEGTVILAASPFYAESGGQMGDTGILQWQTGEFLVEDTQKHGNAILHHGKVNQGSMTLGTNVNANVDQHARQNTVLNHSATHLLHAALRDLLGNTVTQKGSLVAPTHLRFDFAYPNALDQDTLNTIERTVNQLIRDNIEGKIEVMSLDEAKARGAIALFGEKYGDTVRMLSFGDTSIELCGGTHVKRTGDIGLFKITAESSIASGIRRIEALTGDTAIQFIQEQEGRQKEIASMLNIKSTQVTPRIEELLDKHRKQKRDIKALQTKLARQSERDLTQNVQRINGMNVIAEQLVGLDANALRSTLDVLKKQLTHAVIVLGCENDGRVSLVAGVTDDLTDQIKAGEVINIAAKEVGGKGGGRADMAQAGGTQPENLNKALAAVVTWISNTNTTFRPD